MAMGADKEDIVVYTVCERDAGKGTFSSDAQARDDAQAGRGAGR